MIQLWEGTMARRLNGRKELSAGRNDPRVDAALRKEHSSCRSCRFFLWAVGARALLWSLLPHFLCILSHSGTGRWLIGGWRTMKFSKKLGCDTWGDG